MPGFFMERSQVASAADLLRKAQLHFFGPLIYNMHRVFIQMFNPMRGE